MTAADSADLQNFIATEGEHWLAQVARTGLGNNSARSELIARTEVARAVNAAAIQCYRDHGVTHKHLLLSPGACDICKDVAEDGDIPLDAPFSAGGVTGNVHPACRCVPAPAGIEAEPPLADLGKSAATEDKTRAGFLMLRARHPEDGKLRYLLQLRPDGTWGLPGGSAHVGEDPHAAAIRESSEEIGDLPPLGSPVVVLEHPVDGKTVWLHVHDVPFFQPANNGATPEETAGTGWFRRREVGDLPLHPAFRRQWESADWKNLPRTKALQRMVNENGEVLELTPASQAVGSRWPYPKRSDGSEWPDAGPGAVPDEHGSAGGEPPHWNDDKAEPVASLTPRTPEGSDDGKMPSRGRKPAPPAAAFPNQGYAHDESWPQPQTTLTPAPASPVGANTGVPPSGEKRAKVSKESVHYRLATDSHRCGSCEMYRPGDADDEFGLCTLVQGLIRAADVCDRWYSTAEKNDSGHPVVGSVPAETPKPYSPHTIEPQAFDPAETVEQWSPSAGSNIVHDLPETRKGAQHVTDANPVEWRHVYAQLEANFPAKAIEWVKRARWIGPVNVPWSRIDDDDIDSWAASHQPDAVNRFARGISSGNGNTAPSVLVQEPGQNRAFIVDGHHRALARRKLGRPVLAYIGNIDPRDREAAEQTHSSQIHQGDDPANKSEQTPVVSTVHHPLGSEGLWHTPDRHTPERQQLPAYIQNTARALMRDQGMDESRAIATAINAVKEWAQGRAFGGHVKVTDEVRQAAQRALEEWEDLKRSHHP